VSDLTISPQKGLARVPGPRGGRGYWDLNGRKCSGVTTATSIIEKPALLGWAAEMEADYIRSQLAGFVERGEVISPAAFENALANPKQAYRDASTAAKARGTKVDEWINAHIKARMLAMQPGAAPFKAQELPSATDEPQAVRSINAFLEWEGAEDLEFLAFQHAAADPRYLIVGISDWWVIIGKGSKRRTFVGDTKSSKGYTAYPEWELQISANLTVAGMGGTLSTVTPYTRPEHEAGFFEKLGEIGRAVLICDKLSGEPKLVEVQTDIKDDYENVLRAAGLRQRVPQKWN